MSNLKKTHELIRQNEQIVKKSQKHDVNLQKNSTLYFQVGLIVCLLAVFGLFEMTFETTIPKDYSQTFCPDVTDEISIDNFKVYEEPKVEVQPEVKKKVLLTNKIKEVDNDLELKEFVDVITSEQNTTSDKPINPKEIIIDKIDEEVNILVNFVEVVPIYPGCENKKTNDDKRKCMSDKITKLVQRKFNTDLGSELGLTGKQTIRTQFKIDKTGQVTDIKVNGTHPELEKEAERVINIIPEMTPGKQHDKNVGVIYYLPIVFQVQN